MEQDRPAAEAPGELRLRPVDRCGCDNSRRFRGSHLPPRRRGLSGPREISLERGGGRLYRRVASEERREIDCLSRRSLEQRRRISASSSLGAGRRHEIARVQRRSRPIRCRDRMDERHAVASRTSGTRFPPSHSSVAWCTAESVTTRASRTGFVGNRCARIVTPSMRSRPRVPRLVRGTNLRPGPVHCGGILATGTSLRRTNWRDGLVWSAPCGNLAMEVGESHRHVSLTPERRRNRSGGRSGEADRGRSLASHSSVAHMVATRFRR